VFPFPDLPAYFLFLGIYIPSSGFHNAHENIHFSFTGFSGNFSVHIVIMFKGSDPFAFDMLQSSIDGAAGILIAFMVLDLRLRAQQNKASASADE
jgi:hypothetical protein